MPISCCRCVLRIVTERNGTAERCQSVLGGAPIRSERCPERAEAKAKAAPLVQLCPWEPPPIGSAYGNGRVLAQTTLNAYQ